jgi:DNA adenine methylase
MRPESNSPLRYPGGKAVLSDFLAATIARTKIERCIYVEPYAGGAGAAINLLLSGHVEEIILNDADRSIWAFWHSILHRTQEFVELIRATPVTVSEWQKQRAVYRSKTRSTLKLGFSAFFLNRCNRSGILTNGGVIGGLDQSGKWKIDARYNQHELIRRIERIAELREKITICQLDAIEFLRVNVLQHVNRSRFFVYLDPPYYVKGSRLYLNYYAHRDHEKLARFLKRVRNFRWLVTYDDTPEIRAIYEWCDTLTNFRLHYSAAESKEGSEIIIASDGLQLPLSLLQRAG